jgi:predicted DNA-binding transcriptional regulator YafY
MRPDGRVDVEIAGPNIGALAGQLAGFGADVEVFEPAELRSELASIGAELVVRYADQDGDRP